MGLQFTGSLYLDTWYIPKILHYSVTSKWWVLWSSLIIWKLANASSEFSHQINLDQDQWTPTRFWYFSNQRRVKKRLRCAQSDWINAVKFKCSDRCIGNTAAISSSVRWSDVAVYDASKWITARNSGAHNVAIRDDYMALPGIIECMEHCNENWSPSLIFRIIPIII